MFCHKEYTDILLLCNPYLRSQYNVIIDNFSLSNRRLMKSLLIALLDKINNLRAELISERLEKSKPEPRGFDTSRDLTVRRPSI